MKKAPSKKVAEATPKSVKASPKKAPPKTPPAKKKTPEPKKIEIPKAEPAPTMTKAKTPVPAPLKNPSKPKSSKKLLDDDLPLDFEEKEELLEEEKHDLIKTLRDDDDDTLDTAFIPTDTSERYILVVDEEGRRRSETVTIISQILPNAIIEIADDPDEALEIMQDCDFDTYVVNFLMPGYSASPFVKAVANHPEHPLLLGFAADKISDAIDPKKGLKIIPLKRLFDLETNTGTETSAPEGAEG